MRLIDADELENMKFSNGFNEDGILYVPFGEVLRNIRTASTAYDVEKVVEELKENSSNYKKSYKANGKHMHKTKKAISQIKAIDIVKRGGVE